MKVKYLTLIVLGLISLKCFSKDAPLNVLFIVVDDLNTSIGAYGNPDVKTPNIDRLAARGVMFKNANTQYPLCNPSRVSFLSGIRPESTGVYVLSTPARRALPDAVMLPEFFRKKGYYTAGAGKVFHSLKQNDTQSWDYYQDGDGNDSEEKAAIKARYGDGKGSGGDGSPKGFVLHSDGANTRDGINSRTILKLITEKTNLSKPFFLAAGFHKPHLPWTAPESFYSLYKANALSIPDEPDMKNIPGIAMQTELSGFAAPKSRREAIRAYYSCISFTDSNIGRLLDELDRLSLWDTTVVVMLSDNGFHLGDHGGLWSKLSAFEASTHVPLIFAGAGIPHGVVVTTPVELLDVYPTIVDLCGYDRPSGLQGVSLLSIMKNPDSAHHKPASSMVFHYDVNNKVDVLGRSVITDKWRYTEWEQGKVGLEVYSRVNDTKDYNNLKDDPSMTEAVEIGHTYISSLVVPKPGPANRPRALLKEPQDNP
jgi:uncharacterized sulfatase